LFCGTILIDASVSNVNCAAPMGHACCSDGDCAPFGGDNCRVWGQCCLPNGTEVGDLHPTICCSNHTSAEGFCIP
jgi:hypothetical protein